MENLQDVFGFIKLIKLLNSYTKVNPNGGIRHRISGNGTNETDKNKSLTDKDKAVLKEGLQTFINDVQKVIDKL
jgi:hypothetical protein